jgi:hypothetical protein
LTACSGIAPSPVVAHRVDPAIDRHGRYRRVTGGPAKSGKQLRMRRSAKSHDVADLPIGASGGPRHHSATAKQSGPSSSTAAHQLSHPRHARILAPLRTSADGERGFRCARHLLASFRSRRQATSTFLNCHGSPASASSGNSSPRPASGVQSQSRSQAFCARSRSLPRSCRKPPLVRSHGCAGRKKYTCSAGIVA